MQQGKLGEEVSANFFKPQHREKALKLVEKMRESQEKLQRYRSHLAVCQDKMQKYKDLKEKCQKMLEKRTHPQKANDAKAQKIAHHLEKADNSIPKYESMISQTMNGIEKHQKRLDQINAWFRQKRRGALNQASVVKIQTNSQGQDELVTGIGLIVKIQDSPIPKQKPAETCSCCCDMIDFKQGDSCMLDCLHSFHFDCAAGWLVKGGNCPNCLSTTQVIFRFGSDQNVDQMLDAASDLDSPREAFTNMKDFFDEDPELDAPI